MLFSVVCSVGPQIEVVVPGGPRDAPPFSRGWVFRLPPKKTAISRDRGHAWVPPPAPSGGPFVFLGLKGSVTSSKGVLFLAILAHPDFAWHIQHPEFKYRAIRGRG